MLPYLLPRQTPNNPLFACMGYSFVFASVPHASFAFAYRCVPGLNIVHVNSLCSNNSPWPVFGCSLNIRRTAECCLPHLSNTSTSNIYFVFACIICIRFAFRCKPGFSGSSIWQILTDHLGICKCTNDGSHKISFPRI